jgi:hypothetical protein
MRATVHVEENKERPTFEVGTAVTDVDVALSLTNTRV